MVSEKILRVTVCQLRSDRDALESDWEALGRHVRETGSDLVLLPEMPFSAWPFWQEQFDAEVWSQALAAHDRGEQKLAELGAGAVAATRPVEERGKRLNRGLLWSSEKGVELGHGKFYLPDEPGFWEASWYRRGDGQFEPQLMLEPGGETVCVGFMICTELWFMHVARAYGQAGVDILLTPRATEKRTLDKWLAGGRAAAVIAGAYSLSSNHAREDDDPVSLGGLGWVIGPDGEVLALTSPAQPFVTVAIDLERARQAKRSYPRYVLE